MAGSLMVISMGLMRASTKTSDVFMARWSSSDWDMKRASPVSLRMRRARRSRIVGVEVSGRRRNMRRNAGMEAQKISQRDQRQDMAGTEKPASMGPRAGLGNIRV